MQAQPAHDLLSEHGCDLPQHSGQVHPTPDDLRNYDSFGRPTVERCLICTEPEAVEAAAQVFDLCQPGNEGVSDGHWLYEGRRLVPSERAHSNAPQFRRNLSHNCKQPHAINVRYTTNGCIQQIACGWPVTRSWQIHNPEKVTFVAYLTLEAA